MKNKQNPRSGVNLVLESTRARQFSSGPTRVSVWSCDKYCTIGQTIKVKRYWDSRVVHVTDVLTKQLTLNLLTVSRVE